MDYCSSRCGELAKVIVLWREVAGAGWCLSLQPALSFKLLGRWGSKKIPENLIQGSTGEVKHVTLLRDWWSGRVWVGDECSMYCIIQFLSLIQAFIEMFPACQISTQISQWSLDRLVQKLVFDWPILQQFFECVRLAAMGIWLILCDKKLDVILWHSEKQQNA